MQDHAARELVPILDAGFDIVCHPQNGRGLPLDASARYVERSMPRHRSTAIHIPACLSLALAMGVGTGAQERGAGAANANEEEFHALLKQGFSLHQQARFAESIPILERARKLEPQDYFANLLLGIDLLRTGKANES